MLNDYVEELLYYARLTGIQNIVRLLWLFIFFELIRFFLVDLIILIVWKIKLFFNRHYIEANRKLLYKVQPFVSIIIPGKNEGENIYRLVTSLKKQTYQNFEIIVIDDGSDDNTEMIGRSLEKFGLISAFYRNDVRGGKASAANLGLRFAKGDIIVHIDADCTFDEKAIENIILPFFLHKNIGAIGGNVLVRNYKESLCTAIQAIEYLQTIAIGRISASELGIYRLVSGAFGAFTREALEEVGGWEIGPGLDGDITVRLRKIGYDIYFAPDAICYTNAPVKFKALIKQRLRWNRSFVRFRLRKHKDVYYPNKNFRFSTFFAFFENVLYNLVFDTKWLIYFVDISLNFPYLLKFIIPINFLLYTVTYYLKFFTFYFFRPQYERPATYFLKYIPCMPIYYGYFTRIVRAVAYFEEFFFKKSYKDPWNPAKTSRHARRLKI